MSLARNADIEAYVITGCDASAVRNVTVRGNVFMPDSEAGYTEDIRNRYSAPVAEKQPVRVPVKVFMILIAITVMILGIFYIRAVSVRNTLYSDGQRLYDEVQTAQRQITAMQNQIALATAEDVINEKALSLGMQKDNGTEIYYIYAPSTRPQTRLTGGAVQAKN